MSLTTHRSRPFSSSQRLPEPANTPLQTGRYMTVLGPAAAFGVGALSGFGDRLRERLNIPVVNLGRGAAGPSDYLRAWPNLAALMANSVMRLGPKRPTWNRI